jgi:hypothetical protein
MLLLKSKEIPEDTECMQNISEMAKTCKIKGNHRYLQIFNTVIY